MYGKLLFVVGLGAGYLLGTSRGRKDYEMLKQRVSEVWLDPRVQKVAKQASDVVEKNVPMGEKVSEMVETATEAARANVGSASGASTSGNASGNAAGGASGNTPGSTTGTTSRPAPGPATASS